MSFPIININKGFPFKSFVNAKTCLNNYQSFGGYLLNPKPHIYLQSSLNIGIVKYKVEEVFASPQMSQ